MVYPKFDLIVFYIKIFFIQLHFPLPIYERASFLFLFCKWHFYYDVYGKHLKGQLFGQIPFLIQK